MTRAAIPGARPAVWVWLSRAGDGHLHPQLSEALYEARGLARRLDVPLIALADREPASGETRLLARWGVSAVRLVTAPQPQHPVITGGQSPLAGLASGWVQEAPPRATFFVADAFGTVTAPLWAAECGAVYVPGATSVTSDGARFVVARPTLGDQYEALVTVPLDTPLVVTLLPGAVGDAEPPEAAPQATQGAVAIEGQAAPAAPEPGLATLAPDPKRLRIADAERIVAFGRGAFSREAVALVERLADLLGATVAGTRPAADEGWLPFAKQVGLTGAIVTPKLYVAVGISGAPYHMVGVKNPETLIAINPDPEAPILAAAHLGIVADLYDVLPALIRRLEQGQSIAVPGRAAVPPGKSAHLL
jgi:electron transfer flavoprotein alpha subunit